MSFGLAYWILMLLWLVLGLWATWPHVYTTAGNLILFLLLLIVGWQVFGSPIK